MKYCGLCGDDIEKGTKCQRCKDLEKEGHKKIRESGVDCFSPSYQKRYKYLVPQLGPKRYMIEKFQVWITCLNNGDIPVRWLKPYKTGTKVNLIPAFNDELVELSFSNLENQIKEFNKEYDADLILDRGDKSE